MFVPLRRVARVARNFPVQLTTSEGLVECCLERMLPGPAPFAPFGHCLIFMRVRSAQPRVFSHTCLRLVVNKKKPCGAGEHLEAGEREERRDERIRGKVWASMTMTALQQEKETRRQEEEARLTGRSSAKPVGSTVKVNHSRGLTRFSRIDHDPSEQRRIQSSISIDRRFQDIGLSNRGGMVFTERREREIKVSHEF